MSLPAGKLVPIRRSSVYLGIVLTHGNFEEKTLRHRLSASKQVLRETAHVIRNNRVLPKQKRIQIWLTAAWASAMYGLHVVGVTEHGLVRLTATFAYQARCVLRSYSQDTRETNEELLHRKALTSPLRQLTERLQSFILRQQSKPDEEVYVLSLFLPRAAELLNQLGNLYEPAVAEEVGTRWSVKNVALRCGAQARYASM